MSGRSEYLCYTDGACKAGDGAPGGWGFVLRPPAGATIEGHGKAIGTLAKIMEYRAVAEALEALPPGVSAVVFCDNESLDRLDKTVTQRVRQLPGFADITKINESIGGMARRVSMKLKAAQASASFIVGLGLLDLWG